MVEIFVFLDWIACLFIRFVLIISFRVILYRGGYMKGAQHLKRFLYLVVMFIISIIIIIISPRLVSILFGWDMLGLVSYCLIIYYQSVGRFNSGIVTVLTNRIGDVGVLICIGLLLVNGRWNWFIIGERTLIIVIIFLAAITKRAQIPFSSWLPLAIAAPTPVSSLVHSSTLVTAGVYLVLRFNDFLVKSLSGGLLFVRVLTMLISGIIAIFECDLKKVIALSTLRQLGLIIIILSLGLRILGFFHLLTHAVFKSLLFLCAGVIIHRIKDSQDIRLCGNLGRFLPFVRVRFYVSVIALIGIPFLAGFYSKDLIMESLYILKVNFLIMVLIFFSLILTVIYSLRLCLYLFFRSMKVWFKDINERKVMNFSIVVLIGIRLRSGSVLRWLFFYDQEVNYLSKGVKILVFLIFIRRLIFCGVVKSVIDIINRLRRGWIKVKLKNLIFFFSKIWLLNFLYLRLRKIVLLTSGVRREREAEWLEVLERKIIFIFKFIIIKLYFADFKVYRLVFLGGGLLMVLVTYFIC